MYTPCLEWKFVCAHVAYLLQIQNVVNASIAARGTNLIAIAKVTSVGSSWSNRLFLTEGILAAAFLTTVPTTCMLFVQSCEN